MSNSITITGNKQKYSGKLILTNYGRTRILQRIAQGLDFTPFNFTDIMIGDKLSHTYTPDMVNMGNATLSFDIDGNNVTLSGTTAIIERELDLEGEVIMQEIGLFETIDSKKKLFAYASGFSMVKKASISYDLVIDLSLALTFDNEHYSRFKVLMDDSEYALAPEINRLFVTLTESHMDLERCVEINSRELGYNKAQAFMLAQQKVSNTLRNILLFGRYEKTIAKLGTSNITDCFYYPSEKLQVDTRKKILYAFSYNDGANEHIIYALNKTNPDKLYNETGSLYNGSLFKIENKKVLYQNHEMSYTEGKNVTLSESKKPVKYTILNLLDDVHGRYEDAEGNEYVLTGTRLTDKDGNYYDYVNYVKKTTLYAHIYNDGTEDHIIYTLKKKSPDFLYNSDGSRYEGEEFTIRNKKVLYNGHETTYEPESNIVLSEETDTKGYYTSYGKFVPVTAIPESVMNVSGNLQLCNRDNIDLSNPATIVYTTTLNTITKENQIILGKINPNEDEYYFDFRAIYDKSRGEYGLQFTIYSYDNKKAKDKSYSDERELVGHYRIKYFPNDEERTQLVTHETMFTFVYNGDINDPEVKMYIGTKLVNSAIEERVLRYAFTYKDESNNIHTIYANRDVLPTALYTEDGEPYEGNEFKVEDITVYYNLKKWNETKQEYEDYFVEMNYTPSANISVMIDRFIIDNFNYMGPCEAFKKTCTLRNYSQSASLGNFKKPMYYLIPEVDNSSILVFNKELSNSDILYLSLISKS